MSARSSERRRPRAAKTASEPAPSSPATQGRYALAAVLLLAAFLRLWRLMESFPIVGDEAIYLRWAEIIEHQGQWLISLVDGKQPLSYWLYALERMTLGIDPLLGARLISAAAGVAATYLIIRVGERLADGRVGLLAGLFYAVLPWGVMYDRLVYTEALVNLAGVAIVLSSLWAFEQGAPGQRRTPGRAIGLGIVVGLGYFIKSTALQFWFFPVLVGLWRGRADPRRTAAALSVVYACAALFPLFCWAATPEAPTLETHSLVFHSTNFFITPSDFLGNPLAPLGKNFARVAEFFIWFVTTPASLLILAGTAWMLWRRSAAAAVLLSIPVLSLGAQMLMLKFYPSRYPFPQMWPFLVVAAMAAGELREFLPEQKRKLAIGLCVAALAGPMLLRSLGVVVDPQSSIWPSDANYYFGTHAHNGVGVREAVDLLRRASDREPIVILTDPVWGLPADAFFAYLNHRGGTRVYEAWWVDLAPNQPILPRGTAEVWRSHYERVSAGALDFSPVREVYYVTVSNLRSRAEVVLREPGAKLFFSVPKGDGSASLDLWKLR